MKVWGQPFDVVVRHHLDHLIGGKSLRADGSRGAWISTGGTMPRTPTTLHSDSILKQAIALLDNPEFESECVPKTLRHRQCP
ncbi:MAG: hypothetical protein ACHQ7N_21410 [Candidatus Methylomirabilales bacterium]